MNHRFLAYGLFYSLGLAFWLLNLNLSEITLLCVFYSIFVGTVWGLIPKISGTDTFTWRHLLPLVLLVMLMMFSARLRMMISAEVILFTAMALIHLRACIFSFTRLSKGGAAFAWLQFGLFVYGMLYIFQKNTLPFPISRNVFVMSMMALSTLSIGILLLLKRKLHGQGPSEINDEAVGS